MTFPDHINDRHWVQEVRALLGRCRGQSGFHRYTQPAPQSGGIQSPWNSALHAIIYRWFDPEMASDEIKSAVAQQVAAGDDEGMVPGAVYWGSAAREPADYTAPPLLAFAAMQVYHFTGDTNLLEKVYPRLAAWHEWFDRRRDDDQDGLARIDHPGEFIVSGAGVNLNAIRAADLDALAHLAQDMGRHGEAARWEERAQRVRAALQARPTEIYENVNAILLSILFGRGVTPEAAAGMVERAKGQQPEGKLFPWLVESDNPISMVDNWLIYLGFRRYGHHDLAADLAEKSFRLVEQHGFWQFYDPYTGEGLGTRDYAASALALDMLFREKSGKAPRPQCIQDVD